MACTCGSCNVCFSVCEWGHGPTPVPRGVRRPPAVADVVGLVPLPPPRGVEGGVRVIHLAPRCARADPGLVGVRRRVCVVDPGPVVTVVHCALRPREVDPQVAIGHLERDVGDERVGADLGVVAVPHGHIGGLACLGREFVDLGWGQGCVRALYVKAFSGWSGGCGFSGIGDWFCRGDWFCFLRFLSLYS